MASNKEEETASLYRDLKASTEEYQDEHSLSLCNQLLQLDANDTLALQCKVVTLIRLEKYTEALSLMARKLKQSGTPMHFERIYCYYRTHQLQPALDLLSELKSSGEPQNGNLQYLEAQLLYAQDNYEAAARVYEQLLKATDKSDRLYEEIQTNLLAAKAGLLYTQPTADINKEDIPSLLHTTFPVAYEVAFNAASIHLARSEFDMARQYLEMAQKQCSERRMETTANTQDMDEEEAAIVTQLAYTYQLQGNIKKARELYTSVLTSTLDDVCVMGVASNNSITVQEDEDWADAAKKLKVATSKTAETKMKKFQKYILYMNESLLQLYMNKHSACRDSAQNLIAKYPDSDALYLTLAAATYQQHKGEKAVEELKKYSEKKPGSLALRFATIQLQLLHSTPLEALKTLKAYIKSANEKGSKKEAYQPGVVALLVWLYEHTNQSEKAMETLDSASAYWKSEKGRLVETPASVVKQTAAFKLKAGRYHEAAADYEQLVKADPTDAQAIAGLISAYTEIDPAKAEQYGDALPAIAFEHIDTERLECRVPGVKRCYVKKDPKGSHVKKPKKRNPRLPKAYDAQQTPDPERWLPKRERSTFRAKGKNKKAALRGPQGAAVEGGGLGGTGSANIGGRKISMDGDL
ncbi:hypothetical protein BDF14DRAFT_1746377 [Spinellus fusiger]|nr:hypothetical protein BDF14DRAFT_1746377 [Spinellus fusiger]